MITVRCAYCNGRFPRSGRSIARFCCADCRVWARFTDEELEVLAACLREGEE